MKKYYINLTEQERSQIIHSLIDKKNALMAKGRYTDAVDEVILKLMKAMFRYSCRRCNHHICKGNSQSHYGLSKETLKRGISEKSGMPQISKGGASI